MHILDIGDNHLYSFFILGAYQAIDENDMALGLPMDHEDEVLAM